MQLITNYMFEIKIFADWNNQRTGYSSLLYGLFFTLTGYSSVEESSGIIEGLFR